MVVALPVEAEALPVEVEDLVVPAVVVPAVVVPAVVEDPEVEAPAKVKECPAAPEAVNLAEGQAEVELVAARAVAENNAPCS
jgi:hypothetical protein